MSNNLFRHFRGGVYFVITRGKHTETNEDMVAYAGTGVGSEGIWFRPADMFDGLYTCSRCKKTWPRFTRCGEPEAVVCDCPPFEECALCGGWGHVGPKSDICPICEGAGIIDSPLDPAHSDNINQGLKPEPLGPPRSPPLYKGPDRRAIE